jgi:general secretion pathway protein B
LVETGAVRPRPRLPRWAIALCILLAINLIVLLFVLARGWLTAPQTQDTAQAHRAKSDDAPASVPADKPFSPLDAPPLYAPEIPVAAAAPAMHQPADSALPDARPAHRRDPVLTGEDYKAGDEEVLPSINELNLTGPQALPELHLDVHVFATKPAERFVYVNMRKYHEGATLQEGPTIERIRRDGVVLDYQGLRFLLPRQ